MVEALYLCMSFLMHLSVTAIIWLRHWGVYNVQNGRENTVLESVRHNFAIVDSDPDGGIGESNWGQYQSNIGSAIN